MIQPPRSPFRPRPKHAPAQIMQRLKSPAVARHRARSAIIAAAVQLQRAGKPITRSAIAEAAGPALLLAEAFDATLNAEAIQQLHQRGYHDAARALKAAQPAAAADPNAVCTTTPTTPTATGATAAAKSESAR